MSSYVGEHPAKKLARLRFWRWVKVYMGNKWETGTKLVLASEEGGDISVMLGLGAKPESIVAVDIDRRAAQRCAERWPQIDVHHGDVAEEMAKISAQAVFLDFCGPLSPQLCRVVADVAKAIVAQTVLGIAVLNGREHPSVKRVCAPQGCNRWQRLAHRAVVRKNPDLGLRIYAELVEMMRGWTEFSPDRAIELMRQYLLTGDHPMKNVSAADVKLWLLQSIVDCHMVTTTNGAPRSVDQRFSVGYMTSDPDGRVRKTVPMIITGMLCRYDELPELPEATSDLSDDVFDARCAAYDTLSVDDPSIRGTEAEIREEILTSPSNEDLSLLLNVDRRTIGAWRAHATRGTYAKESA